ncbi:MAG TPA: hydroxyacylglutathione hydrolase [Methylophilaceae bacterium]
MTIVPIPAFRDNYIWMLVHGRNAAVVDPGDAAPVLTYLQQHGLTLRAILATHFHNDHIGGIAPLLEHSDAQVYAPQNQVFDFAYTPVKDHDEIVLSTLETTLRVLDVPGHTAIHVAYYGGNSLFCGDTLFGCGCGRIFDGSCEQLHHSLQKMAQLPGETQVYCGHEYTVDNIRFALSVDPHNNELIQRQTDSQALVAQGLPTLPSTMALEKATNPFLRCHTPALRSTTGMNQDAVVFCTLREIKNHFKS